MQTYSRRTGSDRGGAATILLLLIAIGLAAATAFFALKAKKADDDLSKANDEITQLRKQAKALAATAKAVSETPPETPGEKAPAPSPGAPDLTGETARLKQNVDRMAQENRQLQDKADALAQQLDALDKKNADQQEMVSKLKKHADDLAARLIAAQEGLTSAQTARKAELDKAAALAEKAQSAKHQVEMALADSERIVSEQAERIKQLASEIAQFPTSPLAEEKAQALLDSVSAKLKDISDRAKRTEVLFRAMQMLAGTRQEAKAAGLWRTEDRLLQNEREADASKLYQEVNKQVRSQRDQHQENVKLLTEALEKVKGTRSERLVKTLLDREKRAAAAARPAEEPNEPAPDTAEPETPQPDTTEKKAGWP